MKVIRKKVYNLQVSAPYQRRLILDPEWVEYHGLSAKDQIEELFMEDGSMVLRPVRERSS